MSGRDREAARCVHGACARRRATTDKNPTRPLGPSRFFQQHGARPRPILRSQTTDGCAQGWQSAQRSRTRERLIDQQRRSCAPARSSRCLRISLLDVGDRFQSCRRNSNASRRPSSTTRAQVPLGLPHISRAPAGTRGPNTAITRARSRGRTHAARSRQPPARGPCPEHTRASRSAPHRTDRHRAVCTTDQPGLVAISQRSPNGSAK